MIQHHKLTVQRTAQYATIGKVDENTTRLVIACHGQGQLAKHFIRRFDVLDDGKTLVVAPEALSKFYIKNMSGAVGACWMTKEDRLDEIADYTNYLQQLYDALVPQLADNVQIILFGFSQGCATIIRWAMAKFPKVDAFILFGGMLPEDLDYSPHLDYFNTKKMIWAYGTKDQFLIPPVLEFGRKVIFESQLQFTEQTFEGEHKVPREEVKRIFENI